jgi:hypothetical protein
VQAVAKRKKKVEVRRIAQPVKRVVTTSPSKLKAQLPKRPRCQVDGKKRLDGQGKFKCSKEGRARGVCVNHYNMMSRLDRKGLVPWRRLEKLGLCLPAGAMREQNSEASGFLGGKRKKKEGAKRPKW